MPRTHYFAVPFRQGRATGCYPFVCAVDAEEGATLLMASADGVLLYQQDIDPDGPIYGEPEVFSQIGAVPVDALAA